MPRERRLPALRRSLVSLHVLALGACAGGSCAGLDGIPDGFPPDARLDDAAVLRLTEPGLAFLSSRFEALLAAAGVGDGMAEGLDFDVPRTTGRQSGFDFTLCPRGGCVAHLDVEAVAIEAQEPAALAARLESRLESRDAAGAAAGFPLRVVGACVNLGFTRICLVDTTCRVEVDTARGARPTVAVETALLLGASAVAPREGLLAVRPGATGLASGAGFEDADLRFGDCGGVDGAILGLFGGAITGALVDGIEDAVPALLASTVETAFCERAVEGVCPGATVPVPPDAADGVCRASDAAGAECLPILVGLEGRGDLGALAVGALGAGAAPQAPGELLLAVAGGAQAEAGGLTLGLAGGARTTPSFAFEPPPALAHDACVPVTDPPAWPAPTRPAALRGNTLPGADAEAHVAFGLSEAYLDAFVWSLFDGGAFCLAAGTELDPTLTTGLLSLVVSSLGELAFPEDVAPIRFLLRPGAPPDATLAQGDGVAEVEIAFDRLALDLYVWMHGRHVRVLTYTADVVFALDLAHEAGALVPTARGVRATNGAVTGSGLLREAAPFLTGVFGTALPMLGERLLGGLGPVALPPVLGFELEVPEGGGPLVLEEAGARHLVMFGTLREPTPRAASAFGPAVDTALSVEPPRLDPDAMRAEGWRPGANAVALRVVPRDPVGLGVATGYEHAVRLAGRRWSPWRADPHFVLDDGALLFEGRHRVEARARAAGVPETADAAPAVAEVLVDVTPPRVALAVGPEAVEVHAADRVSPPAALRMRARRGEGPWSPWQPVAPLPRAALDGRGRLVVEVRDEAGLVASASTPLGDAPQPAGLPGGCEAAGAPPGAAGAGALLVLSLLVLRRRRRATAREGGRPGARLALATSLAAALAGCGSSSRAGVPCDDACEAASPIGTVCCPPEDRCVDYDLAALCAPGLVCTPDAVETDDTCAPRCAACVPAPPVDPGLLATDLDAAPDGQGGWLLAGYAPGVVGPDVRQPHGDLVVGRVSEGAVAWEIVDGVPDVPPTNDPGGWRGGVTAPGDDVGRHASLAVAGGAVHVAYFDATNGALRWATGAPGAAWVVRVVDGPEGGGADVVEAGRHAAALATDDAWHVAYQRVVRDPAREGGFRSQLVVASAPPDAPEGWSVAEVASAEAPCRPSWCEDGARCFASGVCAAPGGDCEASCGAGRACRGGLCEEVLAAPFVEALPPHVGIDAALERLADGRLVAGWHDRARGDVAIAVRAPDGTWGAPRVIDGVSRGRAGAGVAGRGLALAVDPGGAVHLVYVDEGAGALRHALVVVDSPVVARSVVDDGATDPRSGERFADGRHVVGDDASLLVTPGGELRVLYQDATAATLRLARRPLGGGTSGFARLVLDDADATGFFPVQAVVGGRVVTATFHRAPAADPPRAGVRLFEE